MFGGCTAHRGNPGKHGKGMSGRAACRKSLRCACRQASARPAAWVSAARVFTAPLDPPPDTPHVSEAQALVRRARESLKCTLVGRLELALKAAGHCFGTGCAGGPQRTAAARDSRAHQALVIMVSWM